MLRHVSAKAFVLAGVVLLAGCGTSQEATGSPAPDASSTATEVIAPSGTEVATGAPSPSPSEPEAATGTLSPSPSEPADRTVEVSTPVAFSLTVPGAWEKDPTIASDTTYAFNWFQLGDIYGTGSGHG